MKKKERNQNQLNPIKESVEKEKEDKRKVVTAYGLWYLQKQIKRKVAFKNKSNLSEKVAKIKSKKIWKHYSICGKM